MDVTAQRHFNLCPRSPQYFGDIQSNVLQRMKTATFSLALLSTFGLSSCVTYLDDPPVFTFNGTALKESTGKPVAGATVWVHSERRIFSLLPVDTFGIVGSSETDSGGRFSVTAKVNWPVTILVQNDESIGSVTLRTVEKNRESLTISLSPKPPIPGSR